IHHLGHRRDALEQLALARLVPVLLPPRPVEGAHGVVAVGLAGGGADPVEAQAPPLGAAQHLRHAEVVLVHEPQGEEPPAAPEPPQLRDPAHPDRGLPGERAAGVEEELDVVGTVGQRRDRHLPTDSGARRERHPRAGSRPPWRRSLGCRRCAIRSSTSSWSGPAPRGPTPPTSWPGGAGRCCSSSGGAPTTPAPSGTTGCWTGTSSRPASSRRPAPSARSRRGRSTCGAATLGWARRCSTPRRSAPTWPCSADGSASWV